MIDPKALRIGNLVQVGHLSQTDPHRVSLVTADFVLVEGNTEDYFRPEQIRGIPLTIEILQAAGLIQHKQNPKRHLITFGGFRFFVEFDETGAGSGLDDEGEYNMMSWVFDTPTVHALQNFLYALTGQELEINLPERNKNQTT